MDVAPTGPDLMRRLFRPTSVALFGASPDPARPATRTLLSLLRGVSPPRLYPVNARYDEILGIACLSDVDELPEAPELCVVAVRADAVHDTLEAAADRGARTFLVFSSGFAELDDAGATRERELQELARRRGLAVVGPNSLGVIDFAGDFYGTFGSLSETRDLQSGPVALISQSGAIGSYVCAMADDRGLGFSHMVSTGNEAVLDAAQIASDVLEEPGVRAVALYLKGVRSGRRLVEFARRARSRQVPVVLLRAGDSERGQAAARSHTGALAGSTRVGDAVLRRHGVVGVATPEDLVVACQAVVGDSPWGGRRVGVLTGSGGGGVLISDACARWGLTVAELEPDTRAQLTALLPGWASVANPVDVTATVLIDPESTLDSCLRVLAADENVDEVIVFMGAGGSFGEALARRIVAEIPALGKRCSVIWLGVPSEVRDVLHAGSVPVFVGIEECIRPMALLARAHDGRPIAGTIAAPVPAPPALARFLLAQRQPVLDEDESKSLLEHAGIAGVPPRRVLGGPENGAADQSGLTGPLAVKVLARDIAHKSAAGGVLLGVDGGDALADAVARVHAAGVAAVGADRVRGVLVEPMAAAGVEVIVGVAADPVYGRVLAVGPGGVLAELIDDVTIVLPPAGADEVRALLAGTRLERLLADAGGDTDALCDLVAQLAGLVGADGGPTALPGVRELDLNPVLVHPAGHGVSIVDCLAMLDRDDTTTA